MATNLVSVAMQFLTPDMIAKIASSLGLDRSIAQKAIGGAVPALFAVLTDVASTPNGARQLSNVVTQQQFGSLESLKGVMSGTNPQTLAESGTSLLSGLFGNGVMGTLARSVGKFAGVGESSGNSILGMLGPVILGVLGQQQRLGGLDANGLASLLGSQKDHIAASLPSGLNDLLTSAGLFDKAEGKLRSGIADASATAKPDCRHVGANSFRNCPGSLRDSEHGKSVVALLAPRIGRSGRSRLVCIRSPERRYRHGNGSRSDTTAGRNRRRGPGGLDGRRREPREPGEFFHGRPEIRSSGYHRCRHGPGGPAQTSRNNRATE